MISTGVTHCVFLSAGDWPIRCVYCWPPCGQITWLVSALYAPAALTCVSPGRSFLQSHFKVASCWKESYSWCFPLPQVIWWCHSWGQIWGSWWSCRGCRKKKFSIWFIRCSKGLRCRTLLWSYTAVNLLLYYFSVIVLLIKCLFYSFITVYSFCWYNSQGKLSSYVCTMYVWDKDCVHTLLSNCKGSWCSLYKLIPRFITLDFRFPLPCLLRTHSHSRSFHIIFLQDLKPGNLAINQDCELKVQSARTLSTQTNTTHCVSVFPHV